MKKPNNYENTQAQGEFTPVALQEINRQGIFWNHSEMISDQKRNGRTRELSIF